MTATPIVQSCAFGYLASTQSVANNTWTSVPLDTIVIDTDSYWSAGSPTRFTAPHTGYYLVFAGPACFTSTNSHLGRIVKNGSAPQALDTRTDGLVNLNGGTAYGGPMVFWIFHLTAGDYVESQAYQDSGGSVNAKTQMGIMEITQDCCLLYGGTNVGPYVSATTLSYSTELDPTGMAGSNRIDILVDGYYLILTNVQGGGETTIITKNGSSSPLNGSYCQAPSSFSQQDYAVAYLVAGDYIEHKAYAGAYAVEKRLFGAVYLGDANSSLCYAYPSVDHLNNEPYPGGEFPKIEMDSEWYDTNFGHPCGPSCTTDWQIGLEDNCAHLAICKFDCQGAFTTNQSIAVSLNDTTTYPYWTTNRSGEYNQTEMALAIFPSAVGDFVNFDGETNPFVVRLYYAVKTNGFVTDVKCPCFRPQIYRRLEVPAL